MQIKDVMTELERAGTAQNRKVYGRHGAPEPLFGVSFAALGKLVRRIKRDHGLAEALWETGNSDARTLATMVADPGRMGSRQLDRWARDSGWYMLTDYVAQLAALSPHGRKKAETWRGRRSEWTARAGWVVTARLANLDEELPDSWFGELLGEIEENIGGAENRVREAMNQAVINIGGRSRGLRRRALASAKRLGKVEVDHGNTGCKTPDAATYIAKMWAHAEKKGFESPAAQERGRRRGVGCAR